VALLKALFILVFALALNLFSLTASCASIIIRAYTNNHRSPIRPSAARHFSRLKGLSERADQARQAGLTRRKWTAKGCLAVARETNMREQGSRRKEILHLEN
jgi:cell shape-determining protein MreC